MADSLPTDNLVAAIGQAFQEGADQTKAYELAEAIGESIRAVAEEVQISDLSCALAIVVANHCEQAAEQMSEVHNREMVLFEVIGGLIRRLLLRPEGPHASRRKLNND